MSADWEPMTSNASALDEASVYDVLHSPSKRYDLEAAELRQLIRHSAPTARTLLDVGCGTGEHLRYLHQWFGVAGIDSSPTMLQKAASKLPAVDFHLADMATFRLDAQFDAVICMFSSIGYLPDRASLHAAIKSMAMHLEPGGVMILEPWHHSNVWPELHQYTETVLEETRTITRVLSASVVDQVSTVQMRYEIADVDGERSFDEVHRLHLFSIDDYLSAFDAAKLITRHLPVGITGRGLFVARN